MPFSLDAARIYQDIYLDPMEDCMNPCKTMDVDLYLKSKREDVGGGSIKLIYPREVKVTMEFHSQSMLSLGKYKPRGRGNSLIFPF